MTNVPSLPATTFLHRASGISDPAGSPDKPDSEAMDVIFIEGFEGQTVIGINKDELNLPQSIRIDLIVGLPRMRACETDRILDAIDYAAVHESLTQLLEGHRLKLLEALAEAIAHLLIENFGAHWVRVVLVKPRKFANVSAVGVAIERRRPLAPRHDHAGGEDASVSYLVRVNPAA